MKTNHRFAFAGFCVLLAGLCAPAFASFIPGPNYYQVPSLDYINAPDASIVTATVFENTFDPAVVSDFSLFVEKDHTSAVVRYALTHDPLTVGTAATVSVWDSYLFGLTLYPVAGGSITVTGDDAGWSTYIYAPQGQSDGETFLSVYDNVAEGGDLVFKYHVPDATPTLFLLAGAVGLMVWRHRPGGNLLRQS